jgi:mono/diheme cytochrome c family protein
MKNFILGALYAIALVALVAVVYLGFGFLEVAADARPSAFEAILMTSSVHASVRRHAPKERSPLADSDATVISGGKLYLDDCVGCHGAPGQPPSDFGLSFYPPAPQFPRVGTQYSEAELHWVAKHGIRMSGMFPQSHYSDSDLWRLAAFISRVQHLPPPIAKAFQPVPTGETR